jgi:hypothetical protein
MTPLQAASTAYNYERSRWRVQEQHPSNPRFWIMRSDYESKTTDVVFETNDHGEVHVQFDRLRDDASMRAALLALAECELPEGMLDYLPKFYSREQAFSNVLRAIATEGNTDV